MDNCVNILGINFSRLNLKETIKLIDSRIAEERKEVFHIITANPEIAVQIQEDSELRKISLEADLITPDGVGIVMASRLKGEPLQERVTGFDILLKLLELGNQKGFSFYFFGAQEEVSSKFYEHVIRNYPNAKVTGRHHGYFKKEEEIQIVEEIKAASPDILIVALGSPLADKWIYRYKKELAAKVVIGVGGSLDVITGKTRPTPELWKKLNLEWLHRRIIDPSRKERQKKLKVFAYRAIAEAVKGNQKKKKAN